MKLNIGSNCVYFCYCSVQLWHQTSFLSNSLNNHSKMAKMFSLSPDGRRFLSADGGQQLLHQGAAQTPLRMHNCVGLINNRGSCYSVTREPADKLMKLDLVRRPAQSGEYSEIINVLIVFISVIAVAACLIKSQAQPRSLLMWSLLPGSATKLVNLDLIRM